MTAMLDQFVRISNKRGNPRADELLFWGTILFAVLIT